MIFVLFSKFLSNLGNLFAALADQVVLYFWWKVHDLENEILMVCVDYNGAKQLN